MRGLCAGERSMSDKKLLLMHYVTFGFGCLVIGQMIWCTSHHWGTWRAWLFGGLGLLNIITTVFSVRSCLRWFDSRVALEYINGKLSVYREIAARLESRDCSDTDSGI